MVDTLKTLWLNWALSHPWISTAIAALVGLAIWWGLGLLLWLIRPRTRSNPRVLRKPRELDIPEVSADARTLTRLWFNWGQQYPVRSSAVAGVLAIILWWGFGLLLSLSDRKEVPTAETKDSHINRPRDETESSPTPAAPRVSPSPTVAFWPTVHDHFVNDFAESKEFGAMWSSGMNINLPNQTTLTAEARLHWAFTSRAKFMSFYIPQTDYTYFAAQAIASECGRILKEIENARFTARDPAELIPYDSADLQFTGQIFLYYEGDLSLEQLASLKVKFNAHNLYPQFRGPTYAATRHLQATPRVAPQRQ